MLLCCVVGHVIFIAGYTCFGSVNRIANNFFFFALHRTKETILICLAHTIQCGQWNNLVQSFVNRWHPVAWQLALEQHLFLVRLGKWYIISWIMLYYWIWIWHNFVSFGCLFNLYIHLLFVCIFVVVVARSVCISFTYVRICWIIIQSRNGTVCAVNYDNGK